MRRGGGVPHHAHSQRGPLDRCAQMIQNSRRGDISVAAKTGKLVLTLSHSQWGLHTEVVHTGVQRAEYSLRAGIRLGFADICFGPPHPTPIYWLFGKRTHPHSVGPHRYVVVKRRNPRSSPPTRLYSISCEFSRLDLAGRTVPSPM